MSKILKNLQFVTQSTAPGTPPDDYGYLFASRSSGNAYDTLYFTNTSGQTFDLTAGPSGSIRILYFTGSDVGGGDVTYTWNKPTNLNFLKVICLGGGGGGGAGSIPYNFVAGGFPGQGGGGGGLVYTQFHPSQLPNQVQITVGGGGAGGLAVPYRLPAINSNKYPRTISPFTLYYKDGSSTNYSSILWVTSSIGSIGASFNSRLTTRSFWNNVDSNGNIIEKTGSKGGDTTFGSYITASGGYGGWTQITTLESQNTYPQSMLSPGGFFNKPFKSLYSWDGIWGGSFKISPNGNFVGANAGSWLSNPNDLAYPMIHSLFNRGTNANNYPILGNIIVSINNQQAFNAAYKPIIGNAQLNIVNNSGYFDYASSLSGSIQIGGAGGGGGGFYVASGDGENEGYSGSAGGSGSGALNFDGTITFGGGTSSINPPSGSSPGYLGSNGTPGQNGMDNIGKDLITQLISIYPYAGFTSEYGLGGGGGGGGGATRNGGGTGADPNNPNVPRRWKTTDRFDGGNGGNGGKYGAGGGGGGSGCSAGELNTSNLIYLSGFAGNGGSGSSGLCIVIEYS